MVEGKARISSDCRICGRCASICPNSAIEISLKDNNFLKKSIARISSLVDVT
ncbi:MAG: 4Fe-4S binding protein [Candidatus Hodarchaeota archaeon]